MATVTATECPQYSGRTGAPTVAVRRIARSLISDSFQRSRWPQLDPHSGAIRQRSSRGNRCARWRCGRNDWNLRPFAPEVKQINHLQTMLYENTRLSEVPVGPRMDLVGRFSAFWTLSGPRSGDHGPFAMRANAQSRDRRLHLGWFPGVWDPVQTSIS